MDHETEGRFETEAQGGDRETLAIIRDQTRPLRIRFGRSEAPRRWSPISAAGESLFSAHRRAATIGDIRGFTAGFEAAALCI